MKTRIAVVVPPDVPLRSPLNSTQGCDGIGTIASTIAYRLAQREDYEVHLFAPGDSEIGDGVIFHETVKNSLSTTVNRPYKGWPFVDVKARAVIARSRMEQLSRFNFDIIHGHDAWLIQEGGWKLHNMITTIHTCLYPLPDITPDRDVCARYAMYHPIVTVSKSQQAALPRVPWFGYAHNGIPVERFSFTEKPASGKDAYILFIGRIHPSKGVLLAIKTALRLGLKLKIAGGLGLGSALYFQEKIRPWLDAYPDYIEYVGEVGHKEKNKLYGGALFTICPYGCEIEGRQWQEPFGVVPIESLACGTPALIGDKASAPEIITQGITGYRVPVTENQETILENFVQAGKWLLRSSAWMRTYAREDAEKRWGTDRMINDYEAIYACFLQRAVRFKPLTLQPVPMYR